MEKRSPREEKKKSKRKNRQEPGGATADNWRGPETKEPALPCPTMIPDVRRGKEQSWYHGFWKPSSSLVIVPRVSIIVLFVGYDRLRRRVEAVQPQVVHDLINNVLHVQIDEPLCFSLVPILVGGPSLEALLVGAEWVSVFLSVLARSINAGVVLVTGSGVLVVRPINPRVHCVSWYSDDLWLESLRAGSSGEFLREQVLIGDVVPNRADSFFPTKWQSLHFPEGAPFCIGSRRIFSDTVPCRNIDMNSSPPCFVNCSTKVEWFPFPDFGTSLVP
jgi:hypothetical protein